jgi:hypothetical protein
MADEINVLDVVALTEDLPTHGLVRGQVGTVVEIHPGGDCEVEFSDDDGRAYALLSLSPRQLIVLRYQPARAA